MKIGAFDIFLIFVAIGGLIALRAFFFWETLKKQTATDRTNREARAPKTTEESAVILSFLMRNRLGLKSQGLPLNSTWKEDLKIPQGEIDDFFEDVRQSFLLDDSRELELASSYGDLLRVLKIPEEVMDSR